MMAVSRVQREDWKPIMWATSSKIRFDYFIRCFIYASFLQYIANILKQQLQQGSLGWTEAGSGYWTINHLCHWPPESPPPLVWPLRDLGWFLRQKIHAKKYIFVHGWHYTLFSDNLGHTYKLRHDLLAWSSKARVSLSTMLPLPRFPLLFQLTKVIFASCCRLSCCAPTHCSIQDRHPSSGMISKCRKLREGITDTQILLLFCVYIVTTTSWFFMMHYHCV